MIKTPIILMTGCSIFDNLVYVAKDINRYYDEFSQYFDIYWLICKDQYNGKGSFAKFFDYIASTNIVWRMYDSGLPNQKNYGGDLYNKPLQHLVESLNLDNPFVYVLDDDNVIHPNLFPTLKIYQEHNFFNKGVIVLNCIFDEGYTKVLYADNINILTRSNYNDGMNIVDPSGVLLRYDVIKNNGMYGNSLHYDFKWLFILLYNEIDNNNILDNMTLSSIINSDCIYAIRNSYHNHLNPIKDTKQIDNFKNINTSDIIIDINISNRYDIENRTQTINVPILTDEIKEKIIQLIYKEIENTNKIEAQS